MAERDFLRKSAKNSPYKILHFFCTCFVMYFYNKIKLFMGCGFMCYDYIVRDCDLLLQFCKIYQETKFVYVGNNVRLEVEGIGTCKVPINSGKNLVPIDCLHVPMICRNLVSITCLLHFFISLGFLW